MRASDDQVGGDVCVNGTHVPGPGYIQRADASAWAPAGMSTNPRWDWAARACRGSVLLSSAPCVLPPHVPGPGDIEPAEGKVYHKIKWSREVERNGGGLLRTRWLGVSLRKGHVAEAGSVYQAMHTGRTLSSLRRD